MGSVFVAYKVEAGSGYVASKKYKELWEDMKSQEALNEAEYMIENGDYTLIDCTNELKEVEAIRQEAVNAYQLGEVEKLKTLIADYILVTDQDLLYEYTGNFLSLFYGLDVRSNEFTTEEAARGFIHDNHEKWEMPLAVKLEGKDEWVIGGRCPT